MCECCDYIAGRGGRRDDPALIAEYERLWRARTRDRVGARGWVVQGVEGQPRWAYTVGLWGRGHPELVIFGLDAQLSTRLLDALAAKVCGAELVIEDETELAVDDRRLRAFALHRPGQVVAWANTFYRRRPRASVPAVQLVYPDTHGVWPWEPGCRLFPGEQPVPGEVA